MVVKVNDKEISTRAHKNGGQQSSMSYGMLVSSTDIRPRPTITQFMKQIGQYFLGISSTYSQEMIDELKIRG
ncbi:hypothetical protein BVRB_7g164230 [Beta vulgaris subsp. vulgaris]|nr:hypothetical protein BVRB_7g164230 [Beta vulgaris subsp. vulgaris]